jgi:hypothetical protein
VAWPAPRQGKLNTTQHEIVTLNAVKGLERSWVEILRFAQDDGRRGK